MKKIIWVFITIASLALLIMTGLIIYDNLRDKTNGCFFRRVYGSIGCFDDSSIIVNYEMFNFSETDMSFLDNKDKLSFNDSSITIEAVSYEKNNKEKNLETYTVSFNISIKEKRNANIKKLIYGTEKNAEYLLGDLTIYYLNQERLSLNHSVDTGLTNNCAIITITNNKEYPISLEKLLYNNKYISVTNFQNDSITIGETKEIKINTVIKINEPDIVYFLPILEIKMNGKTYCFMPFNQISNYRGMTYQEAKAYIK